MTDDEMCEIDVDATFKSIYKILENIDVDREKRAIKRAQFFVKNNPSMDGLWPGYSGSARSAL